MEYLLLGLLLVCLFSLLLGILSSIFGKGRGIRIYQSSLPTIPAWTGTDSRGMAAQMQMLAIVGNARLILAEVYAGGVGSRRQMSDKGMSQRQWRRAIRLLKLLRIIEKDKVMLSQRAAEIRLQEWQDKTAKEIASSPAYVLPV